MSGPHLGNLTISFNGVSSLDKILYTAIWSAQISQCVLCDSVHFIQVHVNLLQNKVYNWRHADLHPVFLHISSDMFRPFGTWRKQSFSLNFFYAVTEAAEYCWGYHTRMGACKKCQCWQKLIHIRIMFEEYCWQECEALICINLLTCQRTVLPPSSRQMTIFFIAITLRTSPLSKFHTPESYQYRLSNTIKLK